MSTVAPSIPILIVEDIENAANTLRNELAEKLREWRPDIHVCYGIDEFELRRAELNHNEIVFILDIDLGKGRERAGLRAIRDVHELREQRKDLRYYIVALTSHGEFEQDAYAAGADVFLTKATTQSIDALEVVTRLNWHRAERILDTARDAHKQLGENEYRHFGRRLQHLREGKMEYLPESLATIARALNWPLISPEHSMILSMLRGSFLKAAQTGVIDARVVDMAIESIGLLRMEEIDPVLLANWVSRMEQISPDSICRWAAGDDPSILEDWE